MKKSDNLCEQGGEAMLFGSKVHELWEESKRKPKVDQYGDRRSVISIIMKVKVMSKTFMYVVDSNYKDKVLKREL